ncbi:MAG: galactose oxidase [Sphingobacterium sp.]
MRYVFFFLLRLVATTMLFYNLGHAQHTKSEWNWSTMPAVPDASGFAGAFAGKIDAGILLVGGANFPNGNLPWDGGVKQWTDKIFFLKNDGSQWREYGELPARLGYGASASINNSLLLAGGSNELGHHDKVYRITMDSDSLQIGLLPSLPMTLANMSGILVGRTWYIVGGLATPDTPQTENVCFSLDVDRPEYGWKICPPLPAEGRMLAVLGTDGTSLYVFSGVALREGKRHYLKDAYCYRPDRGWQKLEDLPHAVAAAPSPCFYQETTKQFFLFGGDNGELADVQLGNAHPGFSNKILVFDLNQRKWYNQQSMVLPNTLPPVTTTAIIVENNVVLPMGEVKPGIRTRKVIQGSMGGDKTKNP